MPKYVLILSLLLSATVVTGQDLVTDRPDQTESASIVPLYHMQWEAGTFYATSGQHRDWVLLSNLFRYGVSNKLELRLVTELVNSKNVSDFQGLNGISDIQIGLKYNLLSGSVDIAYLGHLILPSGSQNLKSDIVGIASRINIEHNFGENISSGMNFGYELLESGSNGNFIYTWAIGASLTEKLGFYIEAYGEWEEFEDWNLNMDTGFTYLIEDNLQFDFSIGTGITDRHNFYSFGFSWRIPK